VRKSAANAPRTPTAAEPVSAAPTKTLEQQEYEAVEAALKQTGGNRTHAAQLLGITRRGLIYKLKRLGLG
jgi:DNA-binding NtrC family response regulator